MALAVAFLLALLTGQHAQKHDEMDVATATRVQQREEFLCQEMTRLLQEVEHSRAAEEATLLSVLQHWQFWAVAGALVLLAEICWLARKAKLSSDSCRAQDSSSCEDDEEEEEDLEDAHSNVGSSAMSPASPVQGLPNTCTMLKELVGDLLGVCRMLCASTFMPQMHPAVGMDATYESWSVDDHSITYRLLVSLQPPPGHSFNVGLDTTGQLPARCSRTQVVLECMCSREQLLGHVSCLLHHTKDKLPRHQISRLLRTLCTQSYLDVEKVAAWVQHLVRSAWLFLPQSHHCLLTVLPSTQSCNFQLTGTCKVNICTEMVFAVQSGSSATYPSLE